MKKAFLIMGGLISISSMANEQTIAETDLASQELDPAMIMEKTKEKSIELTERVKEIIKEQNAKFNADEITVLRMTNNHVDCSMLQDIAWDVTKRAQFGEPISEVADKYNKFEFSSDMEYLVDTVFVNAYKTEIHKEDNSKYVEAFIGKIHAFRQCKEYIKTEL